MADFRIGDKVLMYSCEKCKKQRRPRNRNYFEGVITNISNNIATIINKRGTRLYSYLVCLELVTD